jgi:hypothetical protein
LLSATISCQLKPLLKSFSEGILAYNTDNILLHAATRNWNVEALEYFFQQDPKLAQCSQLLHKVCATKRLITTRAVKSVEVLVKAGALINEQNELVKYHCNLNLRIFRDNLLFI